MSRQSSGKVLTADGVDKLKLAWNQFHVELFDGKDGSGKWASL